VKDRNQNSKLDLNWQAEAEQLCFLNHAYLIVFSDESFMKRAVHEIWAPRGQTLFESGGFCFGI
jgi:hypothetical protein